MYQFYWLLHESTILLWKSIKTEGWKKKIIAWKIGSNPSNFEKRAQEAKKYSTNTETSSKNSNTIWPWLNFWEKKWNCAHFCANSWCRYGREANFIEERIRNWGSVLVGNANKLKSKTIKEQISVWLWSKDRWVWW